MVGGITEVIKMSKDQLAKNIKSLRTAYGETQLELALSIGIESPNAIANYEKGERSPKPEIRKKVASHFRVTEDELLHTDLSNLRFSPNAFNDKENMVEMTLLMFPVLSSEDALKNNSFHKAYDAHMRAIESMKAGKEYSETDVDICFDLYSDAAEKDDIPEAAANLLWWLLIFEISMKNQWMLKIAKGLDNSSGKSNELLKSYYLRDMSEDAADSEAPEIEQSEMDDFDEAIKEILKEIKQDSCLSSLADYYLALRYSLGCINNELTEDMNRAIGNEMMWAFAELGNVYAKRFILKGIENNKK